MIMKFIYMCVCVRVYVCVYMLCTFMEFKLYISMKRCVFINKRRFIMLKLHI